MFPSIHGVVSQGGVIVPGEPDELAIVADTKAAHNPSITSHTVPLPAGSGGLLLVIAKSGGSGVWQAAAGWTLVTNVGSTVGRLALYTRLGDGTEPSTLSFATNVGCGSALIALRISGAALTEASFVAANGWANTGLNPPSLTPPWGAAENLWIAVAGTRRGDANISAPPANYGGFIEVHSPNASSSTSEASVALAHRLLAAASEDPGSFTFTNQNAGQALTVAIRPAAT